MNYKVCLTLATLTSLAGCDASNCFSGGCTPAAPAGGGSGGSTGGLITITEDNALAALREAWFVMASTADVPAFVVATGVGDTSGGVASIGVPTSQAVAGLASRNTVYVDPFGPTTYNCPVSGTFIVSGDVTDPNTVTAGDFVAYESSACDSGTGYTVDGNHTLDILSIVGDVASGQYEQGQTLNFTNFQATTPSLGTTLNGDHTAVIDTQSADVVTTSFTGNALDIAEGNITVLIRNFSGFATVETASPFTYTLSATGNANSSAVIGAFDYDVEELIQQNDGEFPNDGILNIFGANGGIARVAVFDNLSVYVQVDANGNNNFERSVQYTWEEFFGN